jgi:excisionase family DNA binding protein
MNATHNGTATTSAPVVMPKIWLTPADVAKLLSIGVRTVWRMLATGRLPQPIRLSRKLVRWDREGLLAFAREQREAHQRGQEGGPR